MNGVGARATERTANARHTLPSQLLADTQVPPTVFSSRRLEPSSRDTVWRIAPSDAVTLPVGEDATMELSSSTVGSVVRLVTQLIVAWHDDAPSAMMQSLTVSEPVACAEDPAPEPDPPPHPASTPAVAARLSTYENDFECM